MSVDVKLVLRDNVDRLMQARWNGPNLLRLSRSDVLEAPYTPDQIANAVTALMEQDPRVPAVHAPAPTAPAPGTVPALPPRP